MQCIPKHKYLEYRPDTFISIRKQYNLDKPGEMEDAIRILREWVQKQQHFKKKDFSDFYLETTIIACKGSVERAKAQLDRTCTFRTLLPQFFGAYNVKTDMGIMFDVITAVVLPKLTPDLYRVYILKINKNAYLIKDFMNYYMYSVIVGEYMKTHDYCSGFCIIVDFTEMNIMDFLPNLNPVQIRQALTIMIEGFGMRIKGMHIFTPSKLVDSFVTILKQVTSPKIANRIHSYTTLEPISNIVPLEILPSDYGGQERPLKILFEEWLDLLASKEHIEHLSDMLKAGTDESCRQTDKFNEQYAGMPGTFRLLTVD
ncbi:alpha-tocopherol transfer protein-like [Epargyreus clarus]|uniref:alpha-tocopherol transfer protein-like n=1 Tax=Epargyreus clarus TaxID=520877 RepID=UPI003C2BCEF0